MRTHLFGALLLLSASLLACGYHLQGRGGALPAGVKVLAVLPFERQVPVLELDQRVTEAVTRELAQRARVRVQSDRPGADAVVTGAITGYGVNPVSYDPADGRANRFRVQMSAKIQVADAAGKVLYKADGFLFEEVYERAPAAAGYIPDEVVAYDVLARDFARALVSAVLEGSPSS